MGRVKKIFEIEADESANAWLFADNLKEFLKGFAPSGCPYEVKEIQMVGRVDIDHIGMFPNPPIYRPSFRYDFKELGNNLSKASRDVAKMFREMAKKIRESKVCNECPDKNYCYSEDNCENKKH